MVEPFGGFARDRRREIGRQPIDEGAYSLHPFGALIGEGVKTIGKGAQHGDLSGLDSAARRDRRGEPVTRSPVVIEEPFESRDIAMKNLGGAPPLKRFSAKAISCGTAKTRNRLSLMSAILQRLWLYIAIDPVDHQEDRRFGMVRGTEARSR